jgi:phosphate acetyltransferase
VLSTRPFVCPPALLKQAANKPPVTTAIANAGAVIALESAKLATDAELLKPILVGDSDAIAKIADEIEWDIGDFQIVDAENEVDAAVKAARLAGAGDAGALMKGHVHTDNFMMAILDRDAGLRIGRRLTHVFHMTVPDTEKMLLITDAAVNIAPDLETKFEAIRNAVRLAQALGTDIPKVAILSGSEEPSERMPSSVDAAALATRATAEFSDALVHGPLAFDNAISPAAAAIKGIDHPVAGNADILLAPNIETGNALFKMMVYFMSACAAGIVLGAKVPAILTSRADPPEARLASAAIAAILADTDE